MKRSYVEPKDAPEGIPCRFCDLPSYADGLGPVHQDGVAVDKKRPLFSHEYCLMNSGGLKQDNQDFSLQSLLSKDLRSPFSSNLARNDEQPMQMVASVEKEDEDNIWAFTSKNRFSNKNDYLTHISTIPAVQEATRVNKTEEYDPDNTGAPNPPSKQTM